MDLPGSLPLSVCRMSSSSDPGSELEIVEAPVNEAKKDEVPKGKKRIWNRGKTITPAKRAKQYADVMEVIGEQMWCRACSCPIKHDEKCSADKHVQSTKHKENVKKKVHLVSAPGPSAALAASSSKGVIQ